MAGCFHRQKRPECPAKPLLGKRAKGFGRFGPADGVDVIANLPPCPLDGDCQILIFGQRVDRITADCVERGAPPRPDCPRNDGNRVELGQRASFEILGCNIFHRLPARDEVDSVADLGIAGHGADSGIDEPARKTCNRGGLELGVGVERDDHVALCQHHAEVEGTRLAAVLDSQQTNPWIIGNGGRHDRAG